MTSKSQEKWTNDWRTKHKERTQYLNDRSAAKRYVRKETDINRLEALIALIKARIQDLK